MRVMASVLNVRSGPGTSFRVLGQLKKGDEVKSLEESGEWRWVVPPGGWASASYLEYSPLSRPAGLLKIVELFGSAGGPLASAGTCRLPEKLRLGGEEEIFIDHFACHKLLEEEFNKVFHRIHSEGFWKDLQTYDGCYENRNKGGSSNKSTHAWGIAVDLNAKSNAQGTDGTMSKDVVRIFEEEGFAWGGYFSGTKKDPMHFQFASGY